MGQFSVVPLGRPDGGVPRHFSDLTDLFICPQTGVALRFDGEGFSVPGGTRYSMTSGVPELLAKGGDGVSRVMRAATSTSSPLFRAIVPLGR